MNIYVGNLSFETTEDNLIQVFGQHGEVTSAKIITDQYSGKSRGFGFVEMPTKDQAIAAIAALNGAQLNDRELKVNEARAREDNRPRGGGSRDGGFRQRGNRW